MADDNKNKMYEKIMKDLSAQLKNTYGKVSGVIKNIPTSFVNEMKMEDNIGGDILKSDIEKINKFANYVRKDLKKTLKSVSDIVKSLPSSFVGEMKTENNLGDKILKSDLEKVNKFLEYTKKGIKDEIEFSKKVISHDFNATKNFVGNGIKDEVDATKYAFSHDYNAAKNFFGKIKGKFSGGTEEPVSEEPKEEPKKPRKGEIGYVDKDGFELVEIFKDKPKRTSRTTNKKDTKDKESEKSDALAWMMWIRQIYRALKQLVSTALDILKVAEKMAVGTLADTANANIINVSLRSKQKMDSFDYIHGMERGTSFRAIQDVQNSFGDIANLNMEALRTMAPVLGGQLTDLILSGIGGKNPEGLSNDILTKFFEQYKEGKNSLGVYVGQEDAARNLYTVLQRVSPSIARLFSQMVTDYKSGDYGKFATAEEWRKRGAAPNLEDYGFNPNEEKYIDEISKDILKVWEQIKVTSNAVAYNIGEKILSKLLHFIEESDVGLTAEAKIEKARQEKETIKERRGQYEEIYASASSHASLGIQDMDNGLIYSPEEMKILSKIKSGGVNMMNIEGKSEGDILQLLQDPEWAGLTDEEIAQLKSGGRYLSSAVKATQYFRTVKGAKDYATMGQASAQITNADTELAKDRIEDIKVSNVKEMGEFTTITTQAAKEAAREGLNAGKYSINQDDAVLLDAVEDYYIDHFKNGVKDDTFNKDYNKALKAYKNNYKKVRDERYEKAKENFYADPTNKGKSFDTKEEFFKKDYEKYLDVAQKDYHTEEFAKWFNQWTGFSFSDSVRGKNRGYLQSAVDRAVDSSSSLLDFTYANPQAAELVRAAKEVANKIDGIQNIKISGAEVDGQFELKVMIVDKDGNPYPDTDKNLFHRIFDKNSWGTKKTDSVTIGENQLSTNSKPSKSTKK